MENLFEKNFIEKKRLAERMRPNSLNDFVGQEHILGKNKLLRREIESGLISSCIFWGPAGTGKTTLAHIIANVCKGDFEKLSSISSGVADAKNVIEKAKNNFNLYGKKTFLFLDECHRWSKAQSDSILAAVEEGFLILIGATTENPNYALTKALLSRCTLFEFKPLLVENIKKALLRALTSEVGYKDVLIDLTSEALEIFAKNCSGDLRVAYNALELAVTTTKKNKKGVIVIDKDVASECLQRPVLSMDENTKFNLLSAFCKSLRGSDTEAALYYAERLLVGGLDAETIARRLIAHASEDIGMANSNALLMANLALNSIKNLGLPEGEIPLAHAIIYICEAEKSNSVIEALNLARFDAKNNADDNIPLYLKNHTLDSKKYKYPHEFGGYVKQQYLPNSLKDRVYYKPSKNGAEAKLTRKKSQFFNLDQKQKN